VGKIDKLSNFLEENFPDKAEEIRGTLNDLKEVMLDTNLEISESMTDLMLDNKYNKARNFIDKSEDISNYIKKLEDIITMVEVEQNEKKVNEEANSENNKMKEKDEVKENKPDTDIEDTEIYVNDYEEEEVFNKLYQQDTSEPKEQQEINSENETDDLKTGELVSEEIENGYNTNKEEVYNDMEQKDNEEQNKIKTQEVTKMFEEQDETYTYNENNVHYLDENFREKVPAAFYIGDEGKEVENWSEMLVETCKMLKDKNPDRFVAFINDDDFKFISRSYFSYNKDQITKPEPMQLKNRKIYIETKLSPNVVNKLIQKLVNKYNIDQRDYKIYYQNEKSVSKEDKKIS